MGQNKSKPEENSKEEPLLNNDTDSKFIDKIEDVAKNLILRSSFRDLTKTADLEYCDKLIILTTKALKHNLNEREITYLKERTEDGKTKMEEVDLVFADNKRIDRSNVENKHERHEMCIGIAKFYIKIYHLFGAIVTTLNPIYDKDQRIPLMKYNDLYQREESNLIPIFAGVCQKKIRALVNNHDYNTKGKPINIKPNICNVNLKNGKLKNLYEEPGFPELEKLYMDEYDDKTHTFTKMSDGMRKEYEKDVAELYIKFSGNLKVPEDASGNKKIKRFSDIKLKDFHHSLGCNNQQENNTINFNKTYVGNLKQKLFSDYINLIESLEKVTEDNQNQLLKILNEVFVPALKENDITKSIIISPALTNKTLDELIEKARKLIIKLYITCEEKFMDGINIFKSIIEKTLRDKNASAIKVLEEKLYTSMSLPQVDTPHESLFNRNPNTSGSNNPVIQPQLQQQQPQLQQPQLQQQPQPQQQQHQQQLQLQPQQQQLQQQQPQQQQPQQHQPQLQPQLQQQQPQQQQHQLQPQQQQPQLQSYQTR